MYIKKEKKKTKYKLKSYSVLCKNKNQFNCMIFHDNVKNE